MILVQQSETDYAYSRKDRKVKTTHLGPPHYTNQKQKGKNDMKRIYNYYGNHSNSINDEGTIFDRNGNPNGRMDEEGRIFDYYGNYIGSKDDGGLFFDRDGIPGGSIDESGSLYDYYGNYTGCVEDDDY